MMKFEIYEGNMGRLEKHINKIARKCEKYGCDFYYKEVGEVFKTFKENFDADGNRLEEPIEITRRFVVIEVEGKAIVNGWRFIGSVEHTQNGNIIHKTVDIEVPERYYTTQPVCEHCNTNRYRKNTYIVYNEEANEFKQVGATCLNDFTHGMDATFISSYYAMFNKLAEFEAIPEGCGWSEGYYHTKEILAYTSAVVKVYGYVGAGNRNSTADNVKDFYAIDHGYHFFAEIEEAIKTKMREVSFEVTEDDNKVADKIISFIENMEESNNYIHNLKVLCSNEMVKYSNINLLCSAIVCWNRELERIERDTKRAKENAELMNSEYMGNIGDRITFAIDSWKALTSWETEWGVTVLYRFIDTNGNVIIWKSSKYIDSEKEVTKLTGTIKEHKEYNGVKQTVVNRCRVA